MLLARQQNAPRRIDLIRWLESTFTTWLPRKKSTLLPEGPTLGLDTEVQVQR